MHFDGRRDLVLYDPTEPERAKHTLTLEGTEPRTIAELLGLPLVMDHLTELTPPLEGVETVRMPVPAQSPYVGRRIGDTRARTRTGASIVAVVRGDRVIPSPDVDFTIQSGDSLVVVGGGASLVKLREMFTNG
ncbi:cation:proton antiporter regulatory subunit [Micromonospora peucetia]|uniref:cation:proton antiporter regulatory subunit n=1 Tax=Micromonospora peucetia TaxID=47871 RepID=UPI001FDF99E9|nr:TrkA C-terminal domain-containing protein [Micromonospora peucetia]